MELSIVVWSGVIWYGKHRSVKLSKDIRSSDMLLVHSKVCALIYFKKVRLFHLPRIMILVGSLFVMNSPMAAPDLIDLFPMSSGWKPNSDVPPPILQELLRRFKVYLLVIVSVLTSLDDVLQR